MPFKRHYHCGNLSLFSGASGSEFAKISYFCCKFCGGSNLQVAGRGVQVIVSPIQKVS